MRIKKHYYYKTITLQIYYIDVSFLGNDWSQSFKKEKGGGVGGVAVHFKSGSEYRLGDQSSGQDADGINAKFF